MRSEDREPPLDACHDCGSHAVRAVVRAGVTVRECGVCGALADDDAAAERVRALQQAREQHIDAEVFGLVAALRALPGVHVHGSHGGDDWMRSLPFVQWTLAVTAGAHLENLTKTMALAARQLALHWVIEVEYHNQLRFVLQPRVDPARVDAGAVRQARADVALLAAAIERNRRLTWWRPVSADPAPGPG